MKHISALTAAGIKSQDIGIITPYNAQVALLREHRTGELVDLEISSVDGFQGKL